jgi:hypothetical protein
VNRARAVQPASNASGMAKNPPHPPENISAAIGPAGVVNVTINVPAFPMVGAHWRDQLSGPNARRWGKLFIDPDKEECEERRRDALNSFRGLYGGEPANNLDECPGAMFYWDGPEYPAHVQPLCASDNQALGRELYRVLRKTIPGDLSWWQVVFQFRG